MTDEEKVKIALLKTGESAYESLLECGMSSRLRKLFEETPSKEERLTMALAVLTSMLRTTSLRVGDDDEGGEENGEKVH